LLKVDPLVLLPQSHSAVMRLLIFGPSKTLPSCVRPLTSVIHGDHSPPILSVAVSHPGSHPINILRTHIPPLAGFFYLVLHEIVTVKITFAHLLTRLTEHVRSCHGCKTTRLNFQCLNYNDKHEDNIVHVTFRITMIMYPSDISLLPPSTIPPSTPPSSSSAMTRLCESVCSEFDVFPGVDFFRRWLVPVEGAVP